MDISLYDATGTQRIEDTNGITVNITMPIPDELVEYGGNNKIAGISGSKLDPIGTRFTTIDGIPCMTFTLSHFSPYAIYVDTANLTAGGIDTTPQTGDGIEPKWFVVIALVCIALVLFLKKDKKVIKVA